MRHVLSACLALFVIGSIATAAAPPRIQLVLMLDTSGSMDGLIDQARSQLWKMVTDLSTAQRQGAKPVLELALYEYGNQGLSAKSGYVRRVCDLTTDLDVVSERLYELRTNGGEEYCGTVILAGVDELRWSVAPADLRLIVIAGNEPFTQGSVTPERACKAANAKGITITTLYCGALDEGRRTGWEDGGRCSGGSYWAIDIDKPLRQIPTPFDTTLARLNLELNATYVSYGTNGAANKSRQVSQDENAIAQGAPVMAERAAAKGTSMYSNAVWDLVDLYDADERAFNGLPNDQLPAALRGRTAAERERYVRDLRARRVEIKQQMAAATKRRAAYIAREEQRLSSAQPSIDRSIIAGIRALAAAKSFTFASAD